MRQILQTTGDVWIVHDDKDTEMLNITQEIWRFEQTALQLSAIHLEKVLSSKEQETIRSMMDQLGQRPFLWRLVLGFEQIAIVKSY